MTAGRREGWLLVVLLGLLTSALRGQDEMVVSFGYQRVEPHSGDHAEIVFTGGIRILWRDVVVRARHGLLLLDREEFTAGIRELGEEGLPRRGPTPPPDKRLVTPEQMRERLRALLQAAGGPAAELARETGEGRFALELFRYLYVEGEVSVVRRGVEVIRARSMSFSPVDDRAVLEDFTLRLVSARRGGGEQLFTVRGDRIVRQGPRFVGRDLSVTTSVAGEPHFDVFAGQAEIIEHGDEFEIRSRGNELRIGGVTVAPLPDATFATRSQSPWPLQGLGFDYSDREGTSAQVDLGGAMNETGGSVHHLITGRPAREFRGDWHLGTGWIEKRGVPLDAGLEYRGGELYSGRTEAFWLDDRGDDFRIIRRHLDGTPVDERNRQRFHTRNRVDITDGTKLDFYVHRLSDPAVYSEFFEREYREDEVPESGFDFRSGADNRLLSLEGRYDVNGFSYADDRSLADRFVERSPVGSFHLFSEPLLHTPWDTPVVLTSATEAGELDSDYDDRFAMPVDDRTFRADQFLELAAPFRVGPIGLRPFASARITYFDQTAAGGSEERWSFAAGVRAGTRLQRTWSWLDGDGNPASVRHVFSPAVSVFHRYKVDGEPGRFHQFDRLDALDEQAVVRLEAFNALQHVFDSPEGTAVGHMLEVDLAQEFLPIADRDNDGDRAGLFEYEVMARPPFEAFVLPDLRLHVEGEHDWNEDRMHTFGAGVQTGPIAGLDWRAEFRTDHASDGAVLGGVGTRLFGRWNLRAGSQYALGRDEFIRYSATLARQDLDWRLLFRVAFNDISDEVRISVGFEPALGGLYRTRRGRRFVGDPVFGTRDDGW